MLVKLTAQQLYSKLIDLNLEKSLGKINFNFAGVSVNINTTDTIGITLQLWLKQYLINNNIFFDEPSNTQEFPDFYLNDCEPYKHMLEVKAFNYIKTPAFDIANFESYCSSVKDKPYRLDADYLIFGYLMNMDGNITIKKLWLRKIWQIAGSSERYPIKTQVKRNMIYNIRPNTAFKNEKPSPFNSKEDFLFALYKTLKMYKGVSAANDWTG